MRSIILAALLALPVAAIAGIPEQSGRHYYPNWSTGARRTATGAIGSRSIPRNSRVIQTLATPNSTLAWSPCTTRG